MRKHRFLLLLTTALLCLNGIVFAKVLPPISLSHFKPQNPVLIFYASETSPTPAERQNIAKMMRWLDDEPDRLTARYLNSLKTDINPTKGFAATVRQQVAQIEAGAKAYDKVGVVIFTNYLAQQGKFRYFIPGETQGFVEDRFNGVFANHYMARSNPLSSSRSLQSALREVASLFDPSQHDFVLITSSHGDRDKIVRPKVLVDTRLFNGNKQKFLKFYYKKRDLQLAFNHGRNIGSYGEEEVYGGYEEKGILFEQFVKVGELKPPLWITKSQYVSILKSAMDRYGMRFATVFAESCNSRLNQNQINLLRGWDLRKLYVSDKFGLRYDYVNYRKVFENAASSRGGFVRSLETQIQNGRGRGM